MDARVLRHGLLNLAGQGAPLLAAVVSVPRLVAGLGPERFGVIALAWGVVGYFSLFDMGLGRALTHFIAEIPSLVKSTVTAVFLIGGVGGLLLALLTPVFVEQVLSLPRMLSAETKGMFFLLSAVIPFITAGVCLRGVAEAYRRFGLVNAVPIPLGVYTFAAPLMVLPFTQNLIAVAAVLAAGRIAAAAVLFWIVRTLVPPRFGKRGDGWVFPGSMLRYGGWMTVGNVLGPLMLYLDRFFIGAMVSTAAVGYYTAPYEVVTKLLIIPQAAAVTLFPEFSASPQTAGRWAGRGSVVVTAVLFPGVFILSLFSPEWLGLWLGESFAHQGTPVVRVLAFGVLFNGIGQVMSAAVQGGGRPDLKAKLHMVELPVYVAGLYILVTHASITGAAVAWSLRVLADTALLGLFLHRMGKPVIQGAGGVFFLLVLSLLLVPSFFLFTVFGKTVFLLSTLLGFGIIGKQISIRLNPPAGDISDPSARKDSKPPILNEKKGNHP